MVVTHTVYSVFVENFYTFFRFDTHEDSVSTLHYPFIEKIKKIEYSIFKLPFSGFDVCNSLILYFFFGSIKFGRWIEIIAVSSFHFSCFPISIMHNNTENDGYNAHELQQREWEQSRIVSGADTNTTTKLTTAAHHRYPLLTQQFEQSGAISKHEQQQQQHGAHVVGEEEDDDDTSTATRHNNNDNDSSALHLPLGFDRYFFTEGAAIKRHVPGTHLGVCIGTSVVVSVLCRHAALTYVPWCYRRFKSTGTMWLRSEAWVFGGLFAGYGIGVATQQRYYRREKN